MAAIDAFPQCYSSLCVHSTNQPIDFQSKFGKLFSFYSKDVLVFASSSSSHIKAPISGLTCLCLLSMPACLSTHLLNDWLALYLDFCLRPIFFFYSRLDIFASSGPHSGRRLFFLLLISYPIATLLAWISLIGQAHNLKLTPRLELTT